MKKDYITVSSEHSPLHEDTFIEEFWTQHWNKHTRVTETDSIIKREEYRLIKPFLQKFEANSRILDGGCGMGEWTVFLSNKNFQVLGLDISTTTIERLKKVLPHNQFVSGDIRHTEFEAASFDAYFSWGTFEHFENGLGECVQEAYRLLKPGGYLFVSVPYQNWRHLLHGARWSGSKKSDDDSQLSQTMPSVRFYQWRLTRSELAKELQIQGFNVIKVVPIHKKFGLKRALYHDFHIKKGSKLHKKMTRILMKIIPGNWVAHMILALAQKPKGIRSHNL